MKTFRVHTSAVMVVGLTACALASEPRSDEDVFSAVTSGLQDSSNKKVRIAWLGNDPGNTYDNAIRDGASALAATTNSTVTPFYANYNAAHQLSQCNMAANSGSYGAIMIIANDGTGIIPCVIVARNHAVPVVAVDLPIGADPTTAEPQVNGQVGAVLIPAAIWGSSLTSLVISLCASHTPCNVAYLAGALTIPFDAIALQDLDAAALSHPNLHIVARAEAFYDRATATLATQSILAQHPDLHVLIGAGDQMAAGGEDAIVAAGLPTGSIAIVGAGAGAYGITAVQAGRWYGTFVALPYDEGTLGADIAIRAAREQPVADPGIDPVERAGLPRFYTRDNQGQFGNFTPQWPG